MRSDAVLAACPGGDPGWLAGETLRNLFGVPADGAAESWQSLAVWVTSFVMKEVPGYTAAAARWAQSVRGVIGVDPNLWADIVTAVAADGPPPSLAVTHRRYVAASRVPWVFDLHAGAPVDAVPPGWLESRVFNLRTLYQACQAKASEWTPPRPLSGSTRTPQPSAC